MNGSNGIDGALERQRQVEALAKVNPPARHTSRLRKERDRSGGQHQTRQHQRAQQARRQRQGGIRTG